jgi:hypothetical protein
VTAVSTPTTRRRRWPLLAIGASAGTATWSGWVGLGQLTGFGVVHPLPGIADSFTINTAVTLPIGVEAYAMYALSIATSNRPLPDRTRRYAWASSAAALLLGMAGQVAYHVMTASHPAEPTAVSEIHLAPWWVIALVSCLPVLVLGAASLLWHLAGTPEPQTVTAPTAAPTSQAQPPGSDPARQGPLAQLRDAIATRSPLGPVTGSTALPVTDSPSHRTLATVTDRAPIRSVAPVPPPVTGRTLTPLPHDQAQPPAPPRASQPPASAVAARAADVSRLHHAIADGDLPPTPTARAIRQYLGISSAYAVAARQAIRPPSPAPRTTTPPQNPTPRNKKRS